jgi:hypothetical protein
MYQSTERLVRKVVRRKRPVSSAKNWRGLIGPL